MKPHRLLLLLCLTAAFLAGATTRASAFYNPTTGRWLSKDPIEERGGANLYRMVDNQPTNAVDPFGLEATRFNESSIAVTYGETGYSYFNSSHRVEQNGGQTEMTPSTFQLATRIRTRGEFVRIVGSISIKITILTSQRGTNTEAHEQKHAKYRSGNWNTMCDTANAYEGTYKCPKCRELAEQIMTEAVNYYWYRVVDSDNDLDNSEYGGYYGSSSPQIRANPIPKLEQKFKDLRCKKE